MPDTTPNYGLDLYETGDAAALTDQYNSSMHTLDDIIKTTNDTISDVSNANQETRTWLNSLGVTDTISATTSKTRWDGAAELAATNEDDIAAIDANLNALHANTIKDAQEISQFITHSAIPEHIVCIGDSWSIGYNLPQPTEQGWNYLLANELNATLHNYADGGAGFVYVGNEGTTFMSQATTAANDNTFNHDNAIILIMGNLNDLRNNVNTTTLTNNVTQTLNTLQASFPNSRIIYFTVNSAHGIIENTSWINNIYATLNTMKNYNVAIYTNMMKLLYLTGDTYLLDANHLNINGHKMLKNWVKTCIFNGTDADVFKQQYQTTINTNTENVTANYTIYMSKDIYPNEREVVVITNDLEVQRWKQ